MNRISNHIILLGLVILLQAVFTNAQPVYDPVLLSSPVYREKLHLFTDRNLYASGEPVLFRAYTKWMRNFPPSSYFHVPLTIINPQKMGMADLATGTTDTGVSGFLTAPGKGIVCNTDRSSYGKREKVTIQLQQGDNVSSADGYCIAVIKKGYLDTD